VPGRIRILKLAREESPRREQWGSALADFDPQSATVLKRDGDSVVCRAQLLGRDVVLKSSRIGARGGLRVLTGRTRADRHWRGAEILRKAKIRTATPILIAAEHGPGPDTLWFVMEYLPGPTVLELLNTPGLPMPRQRDLVRAVATMAHRLEDSGHYNRDSKPSNLIAVEGASEIAVVDCVGIRRLPPLWWAALRIARMHASLYLEALGCQCPPRRTHILRFFAGRLEAAGATPDRDFRRSPWVKEHISGEWNLAASVVREHGDPTPRVNPLAPAAPKP
jgi:hypothetical protein